MSNRIGSSTIYISTLPNNAALARIRDVKLSRQAKHRLQIIEHYLKVTRNVSLTCRHYAISRSYFYKWYKRYNPKYLASLESKSTRPHTVRPATYDTNFVSLIRRLRTDYPSYSAKKLARIVFRDYGLTYSAATIGRIIKRFALYFRAVVLLSKKRSQHRTQVWKQRKPYLLKADKPRCVIEFDMKHIYLGGVKQYAFVAVDIFTKEAVLHLSRQPSSFQAMRALTKVVEVFGQDVVIVNDNGSENYAHAYNYLKTHNITQYFTRPHTPKDKPHVENLIGKLQQECLDEYRGHMTLEEREKQVIAWLNDYHFFRPHQALNYLTPSEYCDTLGLTILRRQVSTM
jgi:transposase InsO family protein